MSLILNLTDANGVVQAQALDIPTGKWATYYTEGVPADIVQGWQGDWGNDDNGDPIVKPVIQIPSGITNVDVRCGNVSWGKIDFKNEDDEVIATQSVHAPHDYNKDVPVNDGMSIHVKHSSGA